MGKSNKLKEKETLKMTDKEIEKSIFEVVEKFKEKEPFNPNIKKIVILPDLDCSMKQIRELFEIKDTMEVKKAFFFEFTHKLAGICIDIDNEKKSIIGISIKHIKMMAEDIFSVNPKYIKLVTFGLLVHEMTHFYVWGHEDDFLKVAINIFNCLLYDFRKEITEITLEDALKTWEEIVEKG